MDLMGLLKEAGGDAGLGAIAKSVGLSGGDAGGLLKALTPALARGLQRQNESTDGAAGFAKALQAGGHQRYLDDPESLGADATRVDGNKILGHLFGSKDASRNVAAHAAEQTGLSSGLIKKALPLLASLVMGAVSKNSDGGRKLGGASAGGLGALAGILLSKGGDDEFGVDDIINVARKLF